MSIAPQSSGCWATARKGEVSIDATTAEKLHLFGSVNDEGLPV